MAGQFTLGKKERIKSRKQTEELFSTGKKFSVGFLRIHYLLSEKENPGLYFGAGVSTRNFKKATDRNRVKRLLRESYRQQKNFLKESIENSHNDLAVFFIYTGKEIPAYSDTFETMGRALKKLHNIVIQ